MYVIDHEIYSKWSPDNILSPAKTVIGSHKIALWICDNNHTFKSAVRNQIRGTECSYCSGKKKIAGVNDLHALYPEIYAELSTNNNNITAIAPHSNKVYLWICELKHEYKTSPNKRISTQAGCPYCSNNRILQGFNDLATTNPELLKDWDFEKNTVLPTEVFAKGAAKIWWICNGHSYNAPGGKRIEGHGCPYCNKGVLLTGFNDLLTKFPELIENEWDFEKNTISPDQIVSGSKRTVWWICNQQHSWRASINNRARKGSGCPDCSKRVSKGELEVREFLENLLKKNAVPNSRKVIAPLELDIYFPDEMLAIEFNGTYWHSNAQIIATRDISAKAYHRSKVDLCEKNSIDLVFVWQDDWVKNSDEVKKSLQKFVNNRNIKPAILNKLESGES